MELEDTEGWTQQCSWNSAVFLELSLLSVFLFICKQPMVAGEGLK